MSINLGIYDLFSYMIPGVLFLYIVNELLRLLGWQFIDIKQLVQGGQSAPGLIAVVALIVTAHLAGHMFDIPANWFCYRLLSRKKPPEVALAEIKAKRPGLVIEFKPSDWNPLFVIIRQRNLELSRSIDKFEADSIMLRNVCFGAFLLAGIEIAWAIKGGNPWLLLLALGALVISGMANKRSHMFHEWFYGDIFMSSLEYGTSLTEVIENKRQRLQTASQNVLGLKKTEGKVNTKRQQK